jgi:hypothetical protein
MVNVISRLYRLENPIVIKKTTFSCPSLLSANNDNYMIFSANNDDYMIPLQSSCASLRNESEINYDSSFDHYEPVYRETTSPL